METGHLLLCLWFSALKVNEINHRPIQTKEEVQLTNKNGAEICQGKTYAAWDDTINALGDVYPWCGE